MKAIGHLVSGSAILTSLSITAQNLALSSSESISRFAAVVAYPENLAEHIGVTGTTVLFTLYFLGLLLPDCDSKESFISNVIYLPFEHRTWTHSIWAVLIFVVGGFLYKPLFGLALGIFVHILMDSFSVEGVCWSYPINDFKREIKTGIKPTNYYTGLEDVDLSHADDPDYVPYGWEPAVETKKYKEDHKFAIYETDHKGSVALVCSVLWVLTFVYGILSVYFQSK